MEQGKYSDSISNDDRIATVFRTLLRLYLSSQVRSRGARQWSLRQLAIEFEIEQAARFAETPHTVSTLAKALDLPVKIVSKVVRELVTHGSVEMYESPHDARAKYIKPTNAYYKNGGDGILIGIQAVLQQAFGDSWRDLEIDKEIDWFPSSSLYTNASSDIKKFRKHFGLEH